MLVGGGLLAVLSLLLTVYCVLDVASSPGGLVRGLPKPLWFVVVVVPLFGPLFWFLLGRPRGAAGRSTVLPPPGRPGRAPDDDEDFLRELRRRAEQQRRRAEQERRLAEERRREEEQPRDEGDRPA